MATKGKVRDFIRLLQHSGFYQVKAGPGIGDHRKFKDGAGHTVQVDGKKNDDIHPKLWKKMMQDAGLL